MPLLTVELVIVLIMVYSLWNGYRRGLLRSFFFLIGLVAATFVALSLYARCGGYLTRDFNIPHPWAEFLSFSLIWIAVSSFVNGVGAVTKKITKFLFIGWLDNLGGAILGLGKGLLIVSLLLVSLTRLPLNPAIKKSLQQSQLAPPMLQITPLLYFHVVRVFKDPHSERYSEWRAKIEKIYREFAPNL